MGDVAAGLSSLPPGAEVQFQTSLVT